MLCIYSVEGEHGYWNEDLVSASICMTIVSQLFFCPRPLVPHVDALSRSRLQSFLSSSFLTLKNVSQQSENTSPQCQCWESVSCLSLCLQVPNPFNQLPWSAPTLILFTLRSAASMCCSLGCCSEYKDRIPRSIRRTLNTQHSPKRMGGGGEGCGFLLR